ncbi:PHP domain-containing protein [Rothia sp. AR01]|uniref:PHP domain-containing protein n=1 Tax=Rothia santali TaxID=2949643 RepID=A0A9X2HG58_9MICC|nr:PHP domain-containing protein [Rothia santali]MCP3427092.1 PHP domain-containing protein [Rothia santali]
MIDDRTDWHTHTDLTDGADPLGAMVAAAEAAGLEAYGVSDHVRRSTTWLPEYVRAVRAVSSPLRIRCGAEAKILDAAGALDLPADAPPLDYLLIADHQFPGTEGPLTPSAVTTLLAEGRMTPAGALDQLVEATCAALLASPAPPILAHLFSLLPKCGLDEAEVRGEHLKALAAACRAAGGAVEVNEKWRCPGLGTVRGLMDLGVEITAGSDAHRAADVGRWSYVREAAAELGAAR